MFDGDKLVDGVATFGDLPMKLFMTLAHRSRLPADLGDGNAVSFETCKEPAMRVSVCGATVVHFQGRIGLLGSKPDGERLARDGHNLQITASFSYRHAPP